jgi:hypothetical protein
VMYRDKNLLELAKGERCLLMAVDNCLLDDGTTTVACHSNFLEHGKGRGLKASDAYTVWGCAHCHAWLDTGSAPKAEKRRAFDAAHERQVREWRDIANDQLAKAWKKEAAHGAIVELGEWL